MDTYTFTCIQVFDSRLPVFVNKNASVLIMEVGYIKIGSLRISILKRANCLTMAGNWRSIVPSVNQISRGIKPDSTIPVGVGTNCQIGAFV